MQGARLLARLSATGFCQPGVVFEVLREAEELAEAPGSHLDLDDSMVFTLNGTFKTHVIGAFYWQWSILVRGPAQHLPLCVLWCCCWLWLEHMLAAVQEHF